MTATIGVLMRTVSDAGFNGDIPQIWKAYQLAEAAHRGQHRVNGHRCITHPVEVATIVAGHGGSVAAVCAALLHDVDDVGVPVSLLDNEFGAEITTMVKTTTAHPVHAENAASRDLMLVAVADRLHNLRTLRRVSATLRVRASLDTLEHHIPMARRLNLATIAMELSDLACAAIGAVDRPSTRERWELAVDAARTADPRLIADLLVAAGGAATALVSGGVLPEWALAAGGGGLLAVTTALLLRRDPQTARRFAEVFAAWRQG